MQFRKDINALRAYAVIGVIIFHFNKNWLQGGFSGVDVFFVISGFLMTSIIFKGIEDNNFSLLKFYSARIKRIVPALLVLIVLLMLFGYLFVSPVAYAELAKHAMSSLLFVSNIVYWQEAGYFDALSIQKFLLHTWSLSVEWQFYLIYPILLIVLSKTIKVNQIKYTIIVLTVLTFFSSIYVSKYYRSASYFILPTRMWEMLLGALAYLSPIKSTNTRKNQIIALVGLLLIICSFFVISEKNSWPGFMTLLPTLGAFLVIQGRYSGKLFIDNKVIQIIGLLSYSLYLYHWPILVISNYLELHITIYFYIIITVFLSVLSYYLIETYRYKLSLIFLVSFVILAFTIFIYLTQGAKYRVVTHFEKNIAQELSINDNFIMIGDSHLGHYMPYINQINIKHQTVAVPACLLMTTPLIYYDYHPHIKENCADAQSQITDILNDESYSIFWVQNWEIYIYNFENKIKNTHFESNDYEDFLKKTVEDFIRKYSDRNIYLTGQTVGASYNISECLASRDLLGNKWLSKTCPETQREIKPKYNELLRRIAQDYQNVYYIDPNPAICSLKECKVIDNNQSLYIDNNHLSERGAFIIGSYILDKINKIILSNTKE